MKLTDQEITLVDAYFAGGCANKKMALQKAGYGEFAPIFQSSRIRSEIQGRQKFLARVQGITEEQIAQEYALLAFQRPGDLLKVNEDGTVSMDFTELTEELRASVKSVKIEEYMDGKGDEQRPVKRTHIEFVSKKEALDSLARFLGAGMDKGKQTPDGLVEKLLAAKKRVRIGIEAADA